MELKDLKTGMLVKTRDGEFYKVYLNVAQGYDAISNKSEHSILIEHYNNDMTHKIFDTFDIVQVYDCPRLGDLSKFEIDNDNLIWQRKEEEELTIDQLNDLLNELGYNKKVKIIE